MTSWRLTWLRRPRSFWMGLRGQLRAVVSATKTLLLASSPQLLASRHAMVLERGWGLRMAKSTKNLGIDFCCSGQAGQVMAGRLRAQVRRAGRYAYLQKLGGDTGKVAATGAKPALTYGAGVVGTSASQVDSA